MRNQGGRRATGSACPRGMLDLIFDPSCEIFNSCRCAHDIQGQNVHPGLVHFGLQLFGQLQQCTALLRDSLLGIERRRDGVCRQRGVWDRPGVCRGGLAGETAARPSSQSGKDGKPYSTAAICAEFMIGTGWILVAMHLNSSEAKEQRHSRGQAAWQLHRTTCASASEAHGQRPGPRGRVDEGQGATSVDLRWRNRAEESGSPRPDS